MFKEVPRQLNFPQLEEHILRFWDKHQIFQKSINSRDPNKPFVFYEGPPTANGRPGIHHVMARTIKDFVCRLKTMQGYRVERKAGWDTHGLPVEIEVEKELGIEGKEQIIEYGVAKFNAKCKENVFRYKKEWDELTRRIGFWLNLDDPYITYTNEYIETVWWILKEFYQRNLMYEGFKIIPYCPRCETALSSHEVSMGYREVEDPSVYVKMKVKNEENTYFLVWTTTPWTLISNVALAVHPYINYVKILHRGEKLILAESRLLTIDGEFEILETIAGEKLVGMEYEPLFQFFKPKQKAWYVIPGDFVSTEEGTGIVHIAPAFGEDDYKVGQKFNLPVLQPVDKSGKFIEEVTPFKHMFVKTADPKIIEHLRCNGQLYQSQTITHSYPHCWRCDSPLLYYAKRSWYIRTTAKKDRLIANNRLIRWIPKEVGEGRFGEWLENNVDWALSRDRFWGTPLNIWVCSSCGQTESIGSKQELLTRANIPEIKDLHKPYIDEIKFPCQQCSGTMVRVPEVIDVWFDSGAMPYAQWHYPFENQDIFQRNFPADFISEGIDQTRGWFYSLLAISVLLFDKPAYKVCLSHELILDKEGQKMSKSRGNTVDPFQILATHGADPLRWYLLTVSPPWVPTRFDEDGIVEVEKKFFGTLINVYSFFVLYANIDKFEYRENPIPEDQRPEIDRWILSVRNSLVKRVNDYLERYDLTRAARDISNFVIEDLSNWFVRRSRRRFWKSEMALDKLSAYQTLYETLMTVVKLIAPYTPFVAEEMYQNLNSIQKENSESVHLTYYPSPKQAEYQFVDLELEDRMALARRIVSLARALRSEVGTKVRQPLSQLLVVTKSPRQRQTIETMTPIIKNEINVKNVVALIDASELVVQRAKPNFKSLGPKFGKNVNKIAEIIQKLSENQINQLKTTGELTLRLENQEVRLTEEDVNIFRQNREGLAVTSEGDLTIALDIRLNEELIEEGLAREFVNRVQNMRKEAGFEVLDRIRIYYKGTDKVDKAIQNQAEYIRNETLSEFISNQYQPGEFAKQWHINQELVDIAIERIRS